MTSLIATSRGSSESRIPVKKKSDVSERIGSSLGVTRGTAMPVDDARANPPLVEGGFRQLRDLGRGFIEAEVVIRPGRQP
jgi:hypothetical protein